jgi:hypothetical protein
VTKAQKKQNKEDGMYGLTDEMREIVRVVEGWFWGETPDVKHYKTFIQNLREIRAAEDGEWNLPSESQFSFAVDYINDERHEA